MQPHELNGRQLASGNEVDKGGSRTDEEGHDKKIRQEVKAIEASVLLPYL
jgi:hypothetical protein